MNELGTAVLDWIGQRRLRPDDLPAALRIAGIAPRPRDWRRFLDSLMLWLGTVCCAAAVIFFLAYNWQDMGRFAKFGLVQLLIVASLALCWRLDLERMGGKAALLLASLLTGALLALVGQTYQTGADTYELFAAWALAVLPWVAIGRFAALWLFWLGLVNLALIFYFRIAGGLPGWWFNTERQLWALFALNTLALVAWEGVARTGAAWLRERWPLRMLAAASGGIATALMVLAIVDDRSASRIYAMPAYVAWLAAAYAYYRHRVPDLFVLAGGVLSVIVVVTVFLGRHLLSFKEAAGFLFIGLAVIGLSAAGGLWLRTIASEERA